MLLFRYGRWLRGARAGARDLASLADSGELVLLGFLAGRPVVAADLSAEAEAIEATRATDAADLRAAVTSLPPARAALLAYARGMLLWAASARFCDYRGAPTTPRAGGTPRRCAGCGHPWFPRIEPAVIVVVETGPPPRCLLARHRGAAPGGYATLAGFVEVGESLEDAVRREVMEETGVPVGKVRYYGSQAWPCSTAGLLLGASAAGVKVAAGTLTLALVRTGARSVTSRLLIGSTRSRAPYWCCGAGSTSRPVRSCSPACRPRPAPWTSGRCAGTCWCGTCGSRRAVGGGGGAPPAVGRGHRRGVASRTSSPAGLIRSARPGGG